MASRAFVSCFSFQCSLAVTMSEENNMISELGAFLGEISKLVFPQLVTVRWQEFRCSVCPVLSCTTSTWRISCDQHKVALDRGGSSEPTALAEATRATTARKSSHTWPRASRREQDKGCASSRSTACKHPHSARYEEHTGSY